MSGSLIPGILVWICGMVSMVLARPASPVWGKAASGSWRMHLGLGLMVGGAVLIAKGIARSIAASSGPGGNELLIGLGIFVLVYVTGFFLAGLAGCSDRGQKGGGEP